MNFIVIGTDHTMQTSDPGFAGLLRGLLGLRGFEHLEAIAEEHHDSAPASLGKRLAQEHGLRWYNLDMTTEEKVNAGILVELRNRPFSGPSLAYRVPSDEIREAAMVEKLLNSGSQTTLVICGFVHFDPLVEKLRAKDHLVETRVYLETVPEIRPHSNLGD